VSATVLKDILIGGSVQNHHSQDFEDIEELVRIRHVSICGVNNVYILKAYLHEK
jgi:hypothetical protein